MDDIKGISSTCSQTSWIIMTYSARLIKHIIQLCKTVVSYLTKQGSLRPFTIESGSYFSFFLDGQTDFTYWLPA